MIRFEAASPKFIQKMILWMISGITSRNKFLARKLKVVGELTNFQLWVQENFPNSQLQYSREKLWLKLVKSISTQKRIIELGVAWGYTTNWFLKIGFPQNNVGSKNSEKPGITIDAFDLFTGLPRAWRNHPVNYFDNGGRPPIIEDERVTFHVGYVEEKITELDSELLKKEELIILFDLDLFEPSLVSYQYLKPSLKIGDILYFDEAFDVEERSIIEHHVLKDFDVKSIGHTPLAICLEIYGIKQN